MCGVHLLVDRSATNQDAINKMVESCTHRGPDHRQIIEISDGVFLASNRLKIMDPRDEANQPITNEDKTAFLSWNGFLYNFQDLKNQLLDEGVIFKTRSDGEVLFQWLQQKGKEGIPSSWRSGCNGSKNYSLYEESSAGQILRDNSRYCSVPR